MAEICLSLSAPSVEALGELALAHLDEVSLMELRIDALEEISREKLGALVKLLKGRNISIIWTVRRREEEGAFGGSEEERLLALQLGDELGADFIDIELRSSLVSHRGDFKAKVIFSFHDFNGCPDDLEEIVDAMGEADVAKVAVQTLGCKEVARVLALYARPSDQPLVAIAMGEFGSVSRLLPAKLGMPWTYAAPGEGSATAPGQYTLEQLQSLYAFESIDAQTRCFAVIGNPVGHSLSPEIHNAHYRNHELNACYAKIRVDEMDDLYAIADALGLEGVSVTVPHKESLVKHTVPGSYLEKVGAANTLIRGAHGWSVENTDIEAAISAIVEQLSDPQRKVRVLLLGAGGVSRALGHGMVDRGWSVTVTNRTQEKAEALAGELGGEWLHWDDRNAHGFDVVINGTSLGMTPKEDSTPMVFEGGHLGLIAFDTVYTPERTLFLDSAEAAGAKTVTGREMFYRQAALQHAHWFGGAPPWESMENLLRSLA